MRLIDRNGLHAKGINFCKATIWRRLKDGDTSTPSASEEPAFPRPVKHGNRYLWLESEVDAYIAALVAKRDAKHGASPVGDGMKSPSVTEAA